VHDLDLARFYADAEGSIVDPGKLAGHRAAVQPLTDFLREVTKAADRSLSTSTTATADHHARCALAWLEAWARGRALLGQMRSKQAEYQRKWDTAGLALAYLKVRRSASPEQHAAIAPWLVALADASRAFSDDPARQRNNHWYWLGLAAGATALAADSPRHWTMAREIMGDAARDIAADGSLPLELVRGARALHYHAFAAMPLVVLAELAAERGEDWYGLEGGALHRLVDLTSRGLADPALFDRLAKVRQERPVSPGAGWLALYAVRFPARAGAMRITAPAGHRWLGGDVKLLAKALAAR
jgi:poly(beta-D-mannuronate) lyase